MKIRIKANSLRIRLTKQEVSQLADTGFLEEQTLFAGNKFVYALQSVSITNELWATLDTNKITMFVSNELIRGWPQNNVVGFNANMPVSENDTLHLLLEKDFACLDESLEAQSDHYANPHKTS